MAIEKWKTLRVLSMLAINVGNYRSLTNLQSCHIDMLQNRLERGPRNASLLGHDYQNAMLKVLADSVLESIIEEVKALHYHC